MTFIGARTIAGLEVAEHVIGEPAPALPLVIALHGRGGTPELPFSASAYPCRVLVPRGPFVVGDGFGWSPRYAREGKPELLARDLAEVADRLRTVLGSVKSERGARGPAIAIGFSQGAMAALALALRDDALVGDVLVGAAWLPPSLDVVASPRLRVRMAHGESDDVVPFTWGAGSAERMRARGMDVELRSFAGVGHGSSKEMDALLAAWRDAALARAWGEPEPELPAVGALVRGERRSVLKRLRDQLRALMRGSGG